MAASIFNGTSRYSSDFQAVIERAVSTAPLPLTQLQQQRANLLDESSALKLLEGKFASLQATISTLESTIGFGSYSTSVSASSILSASLANGVVEGDYSLEVTSLGSYGNTMSKDSSSGLLVVTDPSTQNISAASRYTLTVNGIGYEIDPSSNTLKGLVQAINATAASGVRATVVNVGSSASPDYRISIQSTRLGPASIQLNDGSTDLLDQLTPGAVAKYKVNGMTAEIESDSRIVQLAPGLTVELLQNSAPGEATTIQVKRSSAGVSNALSAFANAYNAILDELENHRGDAKGALKGHSVVLSAGDLVRSLAHFSTGSSGLSSMSAIGLSVEENGRLSFDAAAFSSATSGKFDELATFLGKTDQPGFLKSAGDLLTSLKDATSGTIKVALDTVQSALAQQDARIAAEQARVEQTRARIEAQIAAADALIATLEQQITYFNGLLEAMRAANQSMR